MARHARLEFPGAVYYISINAATDKKAFKDNIDRKRFLRILETAVNRYGLVVHAYVLLDDGYRLLLETPLGNLTRAMQYINSHYMAYVNTRRESRGRIFGGRYKSIVVSKDEYLLKLCRHIHLLPVFKGLVSRPDNYAWSSHNAYVQGRAKDFAPSANEILSQFDGFRQRQRRKFERFVESGIKGGPGEMEALLASGRVLGDVKIEEAINGNGKILPETVTHDEIIEKTAEYFKTSRGMIIENRTKPNPPRNMAIYLCRNGMSAPLEDLGKVFGVCPSCICNTAKRVEAQVRMGGELSHAVEAIRNDLEIETEE